MFRDLLLAGLVILLQGPANAQRAASEDWVTNRMTRAFAAHTADTNINPHHVTADQVGAITNGQPSVSFGAITGIGDDLQVFWGYPFQEYTTLGFALNGINYRAYGTAQGLNNHVTNPNNPHNVTPEQIGAATLADLGSVRAKGVYSEDGTRWIDGTGGVWQVTTVWTIKLTFSEGFYAGFEGSEQFPPMAEYVAERGASISDGPWTFSFGAFAADTYTVEFNNGVDQALWSSVGDPTIACPLVSGDGTGTASFGYYEYATTNPMPRVAFMSDIEAIPPPTLTSTDGLLRWDAGFHKYYRTVLTNGYELYFEVTP